MLPLRMCVCKMLHLCQPQLQQLKKEVTMNPEHGDDMDSHRLEGY